MNAVPMNVPLRSLVLLTSLGASLAFANASFAVQCQPWTPDRRPVFVIPLLNGNPDNCRELSPDWYQHDDNGIPADADEWDAAKGKLLDDMQAAYDDGWRRFNFSLPAGRVCANTNYSGNQWSALPQWKKELIQEAIGEWFAELEAAQMEIPTLGVYTGLACSTDLDSLCTELESSCSPPPGSGCETCADPQQQFANYSLSGPGYEPFMENSLPWAAAGFTEMFIDAAAMAPADLVEWFFHPTFDGTLRLGGEAIPLSGPPSDHEPNLDFINCAPWVARQDFAEFHFGGSVLGDECYFDPELSEIGLKLGPIPLVPGEQLSPPMPYKLPISAMREIVGRGWVPWTPPALNPVGETRIELLKRIYGFGIISNIADFNYDGVVNSADSTDFYAAYYSHAATQGNFVHGDVNGDTFINPDDVADFINGYSFGLPTVFDFGGPNPEYALLP